MAQDGIMRVALNDAHVKIVEALAHYVKNAWSNLAKISVLKASVRKDPVQKGKKGPFTLASTL